MSASARIFASARDLLAKEIDGTAFRLIGVGVSALQPGSPADDADLVDGRAAHAERAMDDLRRRFGDAAIVKGLAFGEDAKGTRR